MNLKKSINMGLAMREMTRKELCNSAGLTQAYLSAIMVGRLNNPTMFTIERIAKALTMTVSEFIALGEE